MLHARLREIRKAKGMTLDEVARRIKPTPTTAQTIGRLETGMRTLTLDWVERIAAAMDVEPSELLALPRGGDVIVDGLVGADGRVLQKDEGVITLRLGARRPLAVRIDANQGQYLIGDVVICDHADDTDPAEAIGCDCILVDTRGQRYFGKLAGIAKSGMASLLPLGVHARAIERIPARSIAPVVMLVRQLTP